MWPDVRRRDPCGRSGAGPDGPLLSVKLLPAAALVAYCMRDMARVTRVINACLVAARLRASV